MDAAWGNCSVVVRCSWWITLSRGVSYWSIGIACKGSCEMVDHLLTHCDVASSCVLLSSPRLGNNGVMQ